MMRAVYDDGTGRSLIWIIPEVWRITATPSHEPRPRRPSERTEAGNNHPLLRLDQTPLASQDTRRRIAELIDQLRRSALAGTASRRQQAVYEPLELVVLGRLLSDQSLVTWNESVAKRISAASAAVPPSVPARRM